METGNLSEKTVSFSFERDALSPWLTERCGEKKESWQAMWLFSQQLRTFHRFTAPKNSVTGDSFCMILSFCPSLGSYLRLTLSLWVMLGIWRPANRHRLSKVQCILSVPSLYMETKAQSQRSQQCHCWGDSNALFPAHYLKTRQN